jgi:hypothetical protein
MNKIDGYKFECNTDPLSTSINAMGGFDQRTRKLVPMTLTDEDIGWQVYEVLDTITAAVEAGVVEQHDWPQQLFKTTADLEAFLEQLADYDDCYRITDRWWHSLARLCESQHCEEGFVRSDEIAEVLAVYAHNAPEQKAEAERIKKKVAKTLAAKKAAKKPVAARKKSKPVPA